MAPVSERKSKPPVAVSVVIPFYARVEWLKAAVNSVLLQTFGDYEVIVVNDGSREDLAAFCAEYGDRVTLLNQLNKGPAAARNMGIEAARGKYVAFLDADDLWHADKLRLQIARMDQTGAVWSHTDWETFRHDYPGDVVRQYHSDCHGMIFPHSLVSTIIATPCVMIRTDVLRARKDLRFCETMRYGQDYYLWLLLSAEFPVERIPQILSHVRLRGNNAISRTRVHLQLRGNIWQRFREKRGIYFFQRWSFFPIRMVYRLCGVAENILTASERAFSLKERTAEWGAKCLYLVPYSLFFILRYLYPVNKRPRP